MHCSCIIYPLYTPALYAPNNSYIYIMCMFYICALYMYCMHALFTHITPCIIIYIYVSTYMQNMMHCIMH